VAEKVRSAALDSTRIVEYYAGVGTLGLGLAAAEKQVVFNEVSEGSIEGLEMGWAALTRNDALQLARGRAGDHAGVYGISDTVIVDPPRKGLDAPLLERLLGEPPRRLIYLSCGIEALMRESRALAQTGKFVLEHISGWPYFPFTEHVETLLVVSRKT
jgi:23S rRNA (uracil1939-C5)-methyltransferase